MSAARPEDEGGRRDQWPEGKEEGRGRRTPPGAVWPTPQSDSPASTPSANRRPEEPAALGSAGRDHRRRWVGPEVTASSKRLAPRGTPAVTVAPGFAGCT